MGMNLKHPLMKKANSASSNEIRMAANTPLVLTIKDRSYSCNILCAQELSNEMREQIWLLFEENMKAYYIQAPSFSWDPSAKRKEMFDDLARFVLLQDVQPEDGHQSQAQGTSDPPVSAFAIFRFEREEKRNMLYCYELQVRTSAQRSGLGKALLNILEKIGNAYSIPRILLTALTANESAFRFYEASGFVTDMTSPSFEDEEDDSEIPAITDYVILCKKLN